MDSDRRLLHCARLVAPMIINGIFRVYFRGVSRKILSNTKFVDEVTEWYTNAEWIGVFAAPTDLSNIKSPQKLVRQKKDGL